MSEFDIQEYMDLAIESRCILVAGVLYHYCVKAGYIEVNPLEPTERGIAMGEFAMARGDRLKDAHIAAIVNLMIATERVPEGDFNHWYELLRKMSIANSEVIKEERDEEEHGEKERDEE